LHHLVFHRFSRSVVEFVLNGFEVLPAQFFEVLGLGDVLPDEAVCVLVQPSFTRAAGVSEVRRRAKLLCDLLVVGKLGAVVKGNGLSRDWPPPPPPLGLFFVCLLLSLKIYDRNRAYARYLMLWDCAHWDSWRKGNVYAVFSNHG